MVIRPDGWIGMALGLNEDAVDGLERYFGGFLEMGDVGVEEGVGDSERKKRGDVRIEV